MRKHLRKSTYAASIGTGALQWLMHILPRRALFLVVVFSGYVHSSPAQQDSYYDNKGDGGRQDSLGEFATDIGGHLPFRAYDEGETGFWQDDANWNFPAAGSLRRLIRDKFTDLTSLHTGLTTHAGGASTEDYPDHIDWYGVGNPTSFDPWWIDTPSKDYLTVRD